MPLELLPEVPSHILDNADRAVELFSPRRPSSALKRLNHSHPERPGSASATSVVAHPRKDSDTDKQPVTTRGTHRNEPAQLHSAMVSPVESCCVPSKDSIQRVENTLVDLLRQRNDLLSTMSPNLVGIAASVKLDFVIADTCLSLSEALLRKSEALLVSGNWFGAGNLLLKATSLVEFPDEALVERFIDSEFFVKQMTTDDPDDGIASGSGQQRRKSTGATNRRQSVAITPTKKKVDDDDEDNDDKSPRNDDRRSPSQVRVPPVEPLEFLASAFQGQRRHYYTSRTDSNVSDYFGLGKMAVEFPDIVGSRLREVTQKLELLRSRYEHDRSSGQHLWGRNATERQFLPQDIQIGSTTMSARTPRKPQSKYEAELSTNRRAFQQIQQRFTLNAAELEMKSVGSHTSDLKHHHPHDGGHPRAVAVNLFSATPTHPSANKSATPVKHSESSRHHSSIISITVCKPPPAKRVAPPALNPQNFDTEDQSGKVKASCAPIEGAADLPSAPSTQAISSPVKISELDHRPMRCYFPNFKLAATSNRAIASLVGPSHLQCTTSYGKSHNTGDSDSELDNSLNDDAFPASAGQRLVRHLSKRIKRLKSASPSFALRNLSPSGKGRAAPEGAGPTSCGDGADSKTTKPSPRRASPRTTERKSVQSPRIPSRKSETRTAEQRGETQKSNAVDSKPSPTVRSHIQKSAAAGEGPQSPTVARGKSASSLSGSTPRRPKAPQSLTKQNRPHRIESPAAVSSPQSHSGDEELTTSPTQRSERSTTRSNSPGKARELHAGKVVNINAVDEFPVFEGHLATLEAPGARSRRTKLPGRRMGTVKRRSLLLHHPMNPRERVRAERQAAAKLVRWYRQHTWWISARDAMLEFRFKKKRAREMMRRAYLGYSARRRLGVDSYRGRCIVRVQCAIRCAIARSRMQLRRAQVSAEINERLHDEIIFSRLATLGANAFIAKREIKRRTALLNEYNIRRIEDEGNDTCATVDCEECTYDAVLMRLERGVLKVNKLLSKKSPHLLDEPSAREKEVLSEIAAKRAVADMEEYCARHEERVLAQKMIAAAFRRHRMRAEVSRRMMEAQVSDFIECHKVVEELLTPAMQECSHFRDAPIFYSILAEYRKGTVATMAEAE